MAEYLTLVRTGNTLALFFGFAPANGLDSYRNRFDAIIETLQIPWYLPLTRHGTQLQFVRENPFHFESRAMMYPA